MKFFNLTLLASLLFIFNNIVVNGKPTNSANDIVTSDLENSNFTKLVKKSTVSYQSVNYINYEESLNEFENSYRGFYSQMYVNLTRSGGKTEDIPSTHLVRILVDLSDFSKVRNKSSDYDLSDNAITLFTDILNKLRSNHKSAVVRFAYHPNFSDINHTYEPSIETILHHQEKLGKLLSNYTDVIAVVECGLLGMYGEMHTSYVYDESVFTKNMNKTISKWLEVLPKSINVSVRQPIFYCDWKGININDIDKDINSPSDKGYRVGIFNDGYFGSETDLGTYVNRSKEVKWISNQAKHTLFGGEFGGPDSKSKLANSFENILNEIFSTHTSYLNLDYYEGTLDNIKKAKYTSSSDKKYKGQTGMVYIQNHLGYRYVVKNVSITRSIGKNDSFGLMVKIANVGFANIIKPTELIIILKNTNTKTTYKFPLSDSSLKKEVLQNGNPNNWYSKTENTFKVEFKLPSNVPTGNYNVYLRLANDKSSSGNNGYPIRFANEGNNVWDSSLGANYLSDLTITDNNANNNKLNAKKYYTIKFKGTLKNNTNYYLGVNNLNGYQVFSIVNEADNTLSTKFRTWHVTSLTEPSFLYLSDGTYGNPGNPTNYCLDLGTRTTDQGYNYLSIVECSKAQHKFKYGGTYSDTIDVYNTNNQHIVNESGSKICLFYSNTPRVSRCEKHDEKPNMIWDKFLLN
ncbi:hypothetical protein BCR32DRAFT_282433 [Anaeromyces robustus]|uniref:DUF4832 domain-containing protein n=1 Tax=Anaeromyces robustus TaxID=1754192 RepID=A0A1Y1WYW8_9FUNG|nr:hypothetical protein BCR32DRAFT_282433 [Anaeromyces robustus]|eukprot:ORX78284.1 hypothetical protein BCR32DRAFT_282433 [Anaeromyces robustus]